MIGGEIPDQVEHVVAEAISSSGAPYRLVALIPADFPLTDNDRRPACYRLEIDSEVGSAAGAIRCDTHPWWIAAGDDTFIFGGVDVAIDEIKVTHRDVNARPLTDEPIIARTVAAPVASPIAFYVVELPEWCWVDIGSSDSTPDPRLGPIGPLPMDAERHAACLAE